LIMLIDILYRVCWKTLEKVSEEVPLIADLMLGVQEL